MADNVSTGNANSAASVITANSSYIQLHTGDPGSAGTANQSSVTTRVAVTWGAATGGVVTSTNQPQWTAWAGTNGENVTDISYWNASNGGSFEMSMQLNTPAVMGSGDSLTLTSLSVTIPTAS